MWSFFKIVLATLVSLVLFTVLGFIILFIILASLGGSEANKIAEQSVLRLKLNREIIERESDKILHNLTGNESSIGLIEVRRAINLAKSDDRIKGIYLELSTTQAGFASLQEIRNTLLDFKKSGKFVIAYGESFSEGAYYLASVADRIYLPPTGLVEFNGLGAQLMFFKGTLDKLEIKPEIFKVGDYKSAVEPLVLDKMSDYNREQIKSFLNAIYTDYIKDVAASRNQPAEALRKVSDSMLVRNARDAQQYGLVTHVAYYDEMVAYMKELLGKSAKDKISICDYKDLLSEYKTLVSAKAKDPKIAVIVANGDIISGKGDDETIGSESLIRQIRKARDDEQVKAIVLRVNSPGGSALASDVIWNEVKLTRGVKPIIASMSDVAASGGYYISMACDKIVAQPTTITGSIGVFGVLLNGQGFLKNKLGITTDAENTGKFSDLGTFTRAVTPYERGVIQQEVERIYEDFTSKAAEGRQLTKEKLKEYAGGRVWSGTEALSIKLVDTLGGLNVALQLAAKAANLKDDYAVVYWPEQKSSVWKELFGQWDEEEAKNRLLKAELGELYPFYIQARKVRSLQGVQARSFYQFRLN